MQQSKNKNISLLIALLVVGLAVIYKMNFVSEPLTEETLLASPKIEEALTKIDKINFNTSIFNDPKFTTFNSLETELPNIPIGRINPFASTLAR